MEGRVILSSLFSKQKHNGVKIEETYTDEVRNMLAQLKTENLANLTNFIDRLDYTAAGKLLEKLEREHKYKEALPIIAIAQKKFNGEPFIAYISGKILAHLNENTKEEKQHQISYNNTSAMLTSKL